MDPRIAEIERAALFAWLPAHLQELDGWKLRFHWNMTGRANSVWPNEVTGSLSLEERLARVAQFYHGRLLPARYQVSPASCPRDLDEALDARGYRFQLGASVQIQSIAALLARMPSEDPGDGLALTCRILARPDDAWFSVQQAALSMEPKWAGLRRSLVQEIAFRSADDASAGFALCEANGEPAAIGIGVLAGDWLGVFGMATAPRFRRRGAAVEAMRSLASWAEGRVSSAYLQVFPENHAALALYEKLGFVELYAYHYRVEPWTS